MTDQLALAAEFDTPTKEQWLRALRPVIVKSNPDADEAEVAAAFDRQLVHRTEDGIEIQPLYSADDPVDPPGMPGFAPFVRSAHAAPVPWEIRQRVWTEADDADAAGELEAGATGVLLEVPAAVDTDALEAALGGVYLDLAPISLATPPDDAGLTAARALLALWERASVPLAERRGSLGVDPLGAWARSGGATSLDDDLAAAADLVRRAAEIAPSSRALVVDGTVWHEAGATEAQELAWTVAAAVATIRSLTDAGVDAAEVAATIEFRWAATADQFTTIAKLRAARRMWARVSEVAGIAGAAMYQHADASRVMLTRYDPWVNALRSTVACFAAALGGADAITVWPHDVLRAEGASALGRRIARNTQTVLQMESNLAKVVDAGGGSWYVEHLTDELARTAWAELQRIEAGGGIVAAVRDRLVHDALAQVLEARGRAVATRRRPLTGLSEFPDIAEEPPGPVPGRDAAPSTPFPPLGLHRLSAEFEAQRGRADAVVWDGGERPTVFLATLGSPAAFTARATFAKNMFEAGGIVAITGEPDQYDPAITSVVCLCSSDKVYGEQGESAAAELRAAGAGRVYVAGRRLGLAGVDEEVGMGSDVLDALTRVLDELGAPR